MRFTRTWIPLLLCLGTIRVTANTAVENIRLHIREFNRLLEHRQLHHYDADHSYRSLVRQEYDVHPTKIIAGHFRQLRTLHSGSPNDATLSRYFMNERTRMESFVNDINRINQMTRYKLHQRYGDVKDRTFDDLNGFLMDEIDLWWDHLQEAEKEEEQGNVRKRERKRR